MAANVQTLKASSTPVIWLAASDDTILARVASDTGRPLVNSLDTQALFDLKRSRATSYAQAADLVVNTDDRTPNQICQEITTWLTQPAQVLAQG